MKVLLTLLANALMLVSLTGCREQVAFGEEVSDDVRAADTFLLSAAAHPQEWRTHGGTYAEQRYSTLNHID